MSKMSGYTKLFNSILLSTIWSEDDATRIVWITMLAMADRNGVVEAAVPGLAYIARVPVDACQKALEKLESPDEHSRSKDFDGRRIKKIDGGWALLNHAKYRAKLSEDERREYFRIKKQEQRAAVHNVKDNGPDVQKVTQAEADTEAKEEIQNTSPTKPVGAALGSHEFIDFWFHYPKKVDRQEAVRAWVKGLCDGSYREILGGLEKWKQCEQWTDLEKVPYPATWLNKRRWKEAPEIGKAVTKHERNRQITRTAVERVRAEIENS